MTLTTIMALLTFVMRKRVAMFFTDDEEVIDFTAKILIIGAMSIGTDSFQCFMQGLIRALGLQQIASYIALAIFWLGGLPLAAIFAFWCDWGAIGLNFGILLATISQGVAYFIVVQRKSWSKIAAEAIERMKKEELELQSTKLSQTDTETSAD